jgi:hypothetical protein
LSAAAPSLSAATPSSSAATPSLPAGTPSISAASRSLATPLGGRKENAQAHFCLRMAGAERAGEGPAARPSLALFGRLRLAQIHPELCKPYLNL